MTVTPEQAEKALQAFKDTMWRDGEIPAMQAAIESALASQAQSGEIPAPPPQTHTMGEKRLPYGLRLQIGKALDRLVCDESTPEQVDQFIATFLEFGLNITVAVPEGSEPVIGDTDRLKIPRLTAVWGGVANAPEALDEGALKAAKEAMVEATGLSPMWGTAAAWAGARAAVTAYLAAISGDQP